MKVAVIIARTASGWKTLHIGENIAEQKEAFKAMKVAGAHVIDGDPADLVAYFDTTGAVKRKRLNDPAELAKVEQANGREAARLEAEAKRAAEKQAREEGAAKAKRAAAAAVKAIKEQVTTIHDDDDAATETETPASDLVHKGPPAGTEVAPLPPADEASDDAPEVADDPDDHFGNTKPGNRKSGSGKR